MNQDIKINDHFRNLYYRLNVILVILFIAILYAIIIKSINERNLIFQTQLIYSKPYIDSLISQNNYVKYQQLVDSLMKNNHIK